MKINRNNYESYFVDYLEGNLDEKMINDFIEFLQQNPDLKEELSLFESVSLDPESIAFNKKEKLYKEKYDSDTEFNRAGIASLEGDISESEKTSFEIYLAKHPEKQKETILISKTKLQPDKTITFNKKNKLYKYSSGKTILLWSVRIAAVLMLAFVFYFLTNRQVENIIPENKIALVDDDVTNKDLNPVVPEIKLELVPVTKDKKKEETTIEQKAVVKPEIKKEEPKTKSNKSLRETNKGRMGDDDITIERIPFEVPAELNRITASLKISQPEVTLAKMNKNLNEIQNTISEERLLADVVKEKTGIEKLSFNKIKKAGLNLVSGITKDNFSYVTNNDGKVTELKFDSRLLAFSIPTNKEVGKE